MATVSDTRTTNWTASEVIAHFGDIPIARIRTSPPPGIATEADVIQLHEHQGRLCELIDGTLVEKTMGFRESQLAMYIGSILLEFVRKHRLGKVFGTDGMHRLESEQIRIPDVSFVSRSRYAGHKVDFTAFWELGCDLAIEVISPSNTRREMERKLGDYFNAGVQLVWYVYPAAQEVVVFTAPNESSTLTVDDLLEGGSVLPGFSIPVAQLFAILDDSGE